MSTPPVDRTDIDTQSADEQDATQVDLSPRKKLSYWKAKHADLEIHEGDERGAVFFGEFDARKVLFKAMEHAWDNLLTKGCQSSTSIEAFEAADRCRCENSERKEFEGLLRFQLRELERVRLGHAEHSYINFVSPCFIEAQEKMAKHAHIAAGPSDIEPHHDEGFHAHHGPSAGKRKQRVSVALTTFHRDLMDFQDLVEVGSEEQDARLALVMEWCSEALALGVAVAHRSS